MLITQGSVRNCGHAEIVPTRGGRGHRRRLRETALSFWLLASASFMIPITNEALHGLFLFMPSELPVCYSYLAGKQHQLAHPKCCVLAPAPQPPMARAGVPAMPPPPPVAQPGNVGAGVASVYAPETVSIQVSPGAIPGSVFRIKLTDGRDLDVTVPHGFPPGAPLTIPVPPRPVDRHGRPLAGIKKKTHPLACMCGPTAPLGGPGGCECCPRGPCCCCCCG